MPATNSSTRWSIAALAMLAVVSTTAVSSCAAPPRPAPQRDTSVPPCPPLTDYTAEERGRASGELGTLPGDAMLGRMMDDYLGMRDACRRERR